jgi:hypothetical protein
VNLKVLVEKMGVPDESVQSTVVSQRASTDLAADQAVVNLGKWVLVGAEDYIEFSWLQWKVEIASDVLRILLYGKCAARILIRPVSSVCNASRDMNNFFVIYSVVSIVMFACKSAIVKFQVHMSNA